MATTTTNYGFDVPTSSDLVKNGATQIALLGQDLDTFLFRPFTRNGVLNSSFNVWQRGTSFTATSVYTADRWYKAGNTPHTFSRQATNDTTNLPNIQYCLRAQRDSGSALTGLVQLANMFETVNSIPYAGKTVTFSFYARAGANYSPTSSALSAQVRTGTGTDQNLFSGYTGSATPITVAATLTTTWQRFSGTATFSSSATEMCVYFEALPTGTAGANDYFEVTGVQIEVGNQASPYAPATPTYATELAACQRYFNRFSSSSNAYNNFSTGNVRQTGAGANSYFNFFFPVEMRIAPTAVTLANITSCRIQQGATDSTVTAGLFDGATTKNGTIAAQATIATAGTGTLAANNNTGVTVDWSAEL
jgi:hypothetical protein